MNIFTPAHQEAFDLSQEVAATLADQDQYLAAGVLMGTLAGQLATIYGPDALRKFDEEYVDVLRAFIARATNTQQ